jgi:hypothetical protein
LDDHGRQFANRGQCHTFKTTFHLDVIRDITGWKDMFGIEFRTARQQIFFD